MNHCSCGKIRHETRSQAKRHLRRLRGQGLTHDVHALAVYRCPEGNGYHVGHSAPAHVRAALRAAA